MFDIVIIGSKSEVLDNTLSHDDVLIVPNFINDDVNDWSIYYKLIEEMRSIQSSGVKNSEWISWHEGAHLISKNPEGSPTYRMILERISKYFNIPMKSVGSR